MTDWQSRILEYLKAQPEGAWASPTQVGRDVGGESRHSSWASPKLKRMVELGLVERHPSGVYRANTGTCPRGCQFHLAGPKFDCPACKKVKQ